MIDLVFMADEDCMLALGKIVDMLNIKDNSDIEGVGRILLDLAELSYSQGMNDVKDFTFEDYQFQET